MNNSDIHIERVIGEGDKSVYVYHFPSQVQMITGAYPVKIGRAGKNPIKRIKAQQASMAERPFIDLVVMCHDAKYLESHIHNKLRLRKLNYYGSEWFDCTPEEIEDIYNISAYNAENMSIGDQLRHFRMKRGLTQVELSVLSKTAQSSISDIESGNVNVSLAVLERLCSYLGLKVSIDSID